MRRSSRRGAAACALAIVVAACSPDAVTSPQGSRVAVVPSPTTAELASATSPKNTAGPSPAATAASSDTTNATPTDVPLDVTGSNDPGPLGIELFSTATDAPIALVEAPVAGELWLADKRGTVVAVRASSGETLRTLVDLSAEVSTGAEQGLLGLAVARDGSELYLSFTDLEGTSRLDAVAVRGGEVDLASRRTLLEVDQPFDNHNGGHLVVDRDGFLYLGLGDGGSGGDPEGNGQDTSTLLGSILRLEPKGGSPYAVPPDNPFVGGGGRPEIWTWGVRNPWRFSFDRSNGDLWVADVGQNQLEEINLLPRTAGWGRGANLGWNTFEGTVAFEGGEPGDPRAASPTAPVFEYSHDDGCSVTGGFVYRGDAIDGLAGWYVYADFCRAELRGLRIDAEGSRLATNLDVSVPEGKIVSFAETDTGELLVLTNGPGRIWRLVPG